MYFAETSAHAMNMTHGLLKSVYDVLAMSELTNILAGDISILHANPMISIRIANEQIVKTGLVERIFFALNPKWARRTSYNGELVALISNKSTKQPLELCNHVDRIYPQTRISHNTPARTVFANIGGMKTMLPLLHRSVSHEYISKDFMYRIHTNKV